MVWLHIRSHGRNTKPTSRHHRSMPIRTGHAEAHLMRESDMPAGSESTLSDPSNSAQPSTTPSPTYSVCHSRRISAIAHATKNRLSGASVQYRFPKGTKSPSVTAQNSCLAAGVKFTVSDRCRITRGVPASICHLHNRQQSTVFHRCVKPVQNRDHRFPTKLRSTVCFHILRADISRGAVRHLCAPTLSGIVSASLRRAVVAPECIARHVACMPRASLVASRTTHAQRRHFRT